MRDSAIRHLAACDKSSLVAAAFFESTVQIWNWDQSRQVGEFETILDFGGRRLTLTAEGSICITASWTRGLCGYSVPNGDCLWRRPDLTQVQLLTLSPSGREINCGFDKGDLAVIDVNTGTLLKTVQNARGIFCSRVAHHELIQEKKRYRIVGDQEFHIPAKSFALHDAVFSPETVCLSEPKVGVSCIDLQSGTQLWQHPDLWTNHLAFATADFNFYCVALKHDPPNDRSLVRIAPTLMDCDQLAFIGPCWESAFSQSGNVLVTVRGDVYETCTGRLLSQLNFPQCDYPDK
jgi:WD40 repeat protein